MFICQNRILIAANYKSEINRWSNPLKDPNNQFFFAMLMYLMNPINNDNNKQIKTYTLPSSLDHSNSHHQDYFDCVGSL